MQQRHLPAFLLILIYLFLFVSLAYAGPDQKKRGKLKDFENAVEKKEEKKKKGKKDSNGAQRRNKTSRRNNDRDDRYEGSIIAHIASGVITDSDAAGTMFSGLGGLMFGIWPKQSQFYNPFFWHTGYALYPYHKSNTGLYSTRNSFGSSIQVSGHYLFNTPNLQGYHVRSKISPLPIIDVAFHVTGLSETFDEGNDHLGLYDVYLNYHRFRHPYFTMWWGVGLKILSGDRNYYGGAFNSGIEIFPLKPFSVHASANVGSLNGEAVWDRMVRLNFHLNRSALYFGYQRFDAGKISIDGIVGGVGVYFLAFVL